MDGVGTAEHPGKSFFSKDLNSGTPDWVARVVLTHRERDAAYPLVNDAATLVWLGQIAALYWINVSLIGGQIFPIELFGLEFEVCEQGLALLSLVPIWLYRGRQGHHSKVFQYACYAFYPVHMLILGLIQLSL